MQSENENSNTTPPSNQSSLVLASLTPVFSRIMVLPGRVAGWLYDNPLFLGQLVSTLTQVVLSAGMSSMQQAHTLQYHEKTTHDTELKDEFIKLVARAEHYYSQASYRKAVEVYIQVFSLYEKIASVARPLWQENFKQVYCNYLRSLFHLGEYQQAAAYIENLKQENVQKNNKYQELLKESVEFHYLATATYLKLHLYDSTKKGQYKKELQHYAQLTFAKEKKSDIFLLLLYLSLSDTSDSAATEKLTKQFLCYLKDSSLLENSIYATDMFYIAATLIQAQEQKYYQALACYYYCFEQWPNEPIFLAIKQQLCKNIVDVLDKLSRNSSSSKSSSHPNKTFQLKEYLTQIHSGFSKQSKTVDNDGQEVMVDAIQDIQLSTSKLKTLFFAKQAELEALSSSTQQFTETAKEVALNHQQEIKSVQQRKACCLV